MYVTDMSEGPSANLWYNVIFRVRLRSVALRNQRERPLSGPLGVIHSSELTEGPDRARGSCDSPLLFSQHHLSRRG